MLQSGDADSADPHGNSVAAPSKTALQQDGLQSAADAQDVQQLRVSEHAAQECF